jgi:hypothetical protein
MNSTSGKHDAAKRIAKYCEQVLDLQNAEFSEEDFYQSLPLCVIDAVYSIGVRYEGVKRTVERYCNYFNLQRIRNNREAIPPRASQESVSDFVDTIELIGVENFSKNILRNQQRTSTTNGILKAEAVYQFVKVLKKYGINYFQDLPGGKETDGFGLEIISIPGQRSGLSLRYFLMLAGFQDFVKPDRHIKAFIANALGEKVGDRVATQLLRDACKLLKKKYSHLTPMLLDNVIWKYQRNNGNPQKPACKKGKNKFSRCCKPITEPLYLTEGRDEKMSPVYGTIVGTATFYSNHVERLEILLYKNQDHGLPLKLGYRVPFSFTIGNSTLTAGMRINAQGYPWICPDLYNQRNEKSRLADVLRENGFKKNQRVLLHIDPNKPSIKLEPEH